MKTLLLIIFGSLLWFIKPPHSEKPTRALVATCYGNTPCKACSNCSRCKHCSNGGTCGICAPAKTTTKNTFTSNTPNNAKTNAYIGQCKALTKRRRGVKEAQVAMVIAGNMANKIRSYGNP